MHDATSDHVNRHEPRQSFVADLERQVRYELRRAEVRIPGAPAPLRWSRGVLAAAAVVIAIVSATVGGGAVVLAQQAQRADLRERLVSTYEQRVLLEKVRLVQARQAMDEGERRAAVGIETQEALLDARARVAEAEAAVKLVELDLAEVRLTSQEPVSSASAPLVSGRDFVSERWQIELTVPQAALELERRRLNAAQVRVDVGLARSEDVNAAAARAFEVEAAVSTLRQKLSIRQSFLKGLASAALTDLRVLEAEAEFRRLTLERRIELAARQLKDMEVRAQIGTASPLDVSGARLQVQELQLALTRAAYDLDLIREQIKKLREP